MVTALTFFVLKVFGSFIKYHEIPPVVDVKVGEGEHPEIFVLGAPLEIGSRMYAYKRHICTFHVKSFWVFLTVIIRTSIHCVVP